MHKVLACRMTSNSVYLAFALCYTLLAASVPEIHVYTALSVQMIGFVEYLTVTVTC